MTTISIEIDDIAARILENYAALQDQTTTEYVYDALMERLEDEHDLQLAREAKAEYEKNPVTYSHAEVAKMLGLADSGH